MGKVKNIFFWLAIGLLLTTIFLFLYFAGKFQSKKEIPDQGKIFLTLSPSGNPEAENDIYAYDVKKKTLEKVFPEGHAGFSYLMNSFSANGEKMALTVSSNEESQIYLIDENNQSKKPITKSPTLHKRNIQWSPDQKTLVFQAMGEKSQDNSKLNMLKLEDWNIFITDLSGQETFITQGANPMFLPNGKILALKSDGLYIFEANGQDKGKRLWLASKENKINLGSKLAVSDDGKNLIWTYAGKFFVMRVSSWEPLVIEKNQAIDKQAYWPVFSPNGKNFAIEEVDEKNENPRLVIYDLQTLGIRQTQNLNEFDQMSMFMSDWK